MRSAEFDREQVLRAAIKAFVAKGYTKTSMQDLKKATGLHPGSIYCAFESKQGLMLAAIEQYEKDKSAEFETFFVDQPRILDGILAYLENTVSEVTAIGHDCQKACLTQKALSELSDNEPEIEIALKDSIQQWQHGFVEVFQKAQQAGEISGDRSAEQRTQSLVMGILGMRTYAQTQADKTLLTQLAHQLFDDVCR
ncbi:TetR/AcrR family transcriptional regulator [Catenovulum sp. SM1970]|uniref:TetR/AcrR family transcriptional regulator n=1 Tax=Marinifaba aquimaris TaxID=2741323 RepID=UPI001573153D|nr:TetR/AcrR family transcriptional regulator [Marinifaba aquimaris]NTS76327.1 TetR/AcrR family transcriptional regulator [Marinifaba aquimaris]